MPLKLTKLILLLSLLIAPATIWAQFPSEGADSLPSRARKLIQFLDTGNFASAVDTFDSNMRSLMNAEKLETVWDSLELRFGAYRTMGAPRPDKVSGFDVIFVPVQFERVLLEAKVVFDPNKRVTGLFFVSPSETSPTFDAPQYADPDTFIEEAYTVENGDYELPGTLSIPRNTNDLPIVILIAGSGPNDRDETIGPNKPLRDIAHGLAARGIASLRYDKRTHVYGTRLDIRTLTYREEVVDDAVQAIRQIRKDDRFRRDGIFILGHSLGGHLVPEIAIQARSTILGGQGRISTDGVPFSDSLPIPNSLPLPTAFLFPPSDHLVGAIIMAGSARSIVESVTDQLNHIAGEDGEITLQERSTILSFEAGIKALRKSKDPDHPPVMGMTYPYLAALEDYDCIKTASKLKIPLLIAQGDKDYQVTVGEDYSMWRKGLSEQENVTFKLYPDLNHLFMPTPGTSYPSDYENPGHVSDEFISDMADWIDGVLESDN